MTCPFRMRLAIGAILLACSGVSAAAESYDNCVGFVESLPANISTQGTWCLNKNLSTAMASGSAITVAANNITIDCNGFKVGGLAAGEASLAIGINLGGTANATIRNCGIRGFRTGIRASGGANAGGHLIEDNRLDQNLLSGIDFVGGSRNLVRRNQVLDTGGAPGASPTYAMYVHGDSIDNQIDGVFSAAANGSTYGIRVGANQGNLTRGNRIRGLSRSGTGSAYGIATGGYAGDRVEDNHVASTFAVDGDGIRANTGSFCRGNTVTNFSGGIVLCIDAGGNFSN